MLEVWRSKTAKQFVKTTEKHWGIGTVPKGPQWPHVSHKALALGTAFLPPQVHPQPSRSWRPPSTSSLFAHSLCVPQHSPLVPPGRSSTTRKYYTPAPLLPKPLGLWLCLSSLCFQTRVTQSLPTWAVCTAECLGDALSFWTCRASGHPGRSGVLNHQPFSFSVLSTFLSNQTRKTGAAEKHTV